MTVDAALRQGLWMFLGALESIEPVSFVATWFKGSYSLSQACSSCILRATCALR